MKLAFYFSNSYLYKTMEWRIAAWRQVLTLRTWG